MCVAHSILKLLKNVFFIGVLKHKGSHAQLVVENRDNYLGAKPKQIAILHWPLCGSDVKADIFFTCSL